MRQAAGACVLLVHLAGLPGALADYESARKTLERGDFRAGIASLRAAAHDGDPRAQNHLGTLFEDGRLVSRDFGRAVFWYRRSADQGHARGQLNLGRMYRAGLGLERDERRAAAWYRSAARQGLAEAQFFLGLMYETGRGIERDPILSWMWYRLAAEQDDEDARYRGDRLAAGFDDDELLRARGALEGFRESVTPQTREPSSGPSDPSRAAAAPGGGGGEGGGRTKSPRMRGDPHIFRVQAALIELGYSPGTHDGEAGSQTRKAIRQFEIEHGYRPRGQIDRRVLDRLREALEAGKPAASVVREIQSRLQELGYSVGTIDGVPGPRTAAAVEAFQRARQLPVDGRLSVEVLGLLRGTKP